MDRDYDIRDQFKIANKRGSRAMIMGARPQTEILNIFIKTIKTEELETMKKVQEDTARDLRRTFDDWFYLNEHNVPLLKDEKVRDARQCVIGLQMFYMANVLVESINRANAALAMTVLELDKRARNR